MTALGGSHDDRVGTPIPQAEAVTVRGLVKSFGDTRVLRGVDLTVPAGSLVALLGPSGCGKTTLLRAIAGLERPEGGAVQVGDRVLSGPAGFTPAERRHIGMVFQDAALFPHLSVARNVSYGLPRRDPHRAARVAEALELVGLAGFESRAPATLSGGQAQRVAIARALAPRPSVLLLDEPFASLDAPLRAELRRELRRVLATIGATAVFVTHDQEEAFVVGDEVAIMSGGRVAQQGRPTALYELPATREIAEFIGDANFVPGRAMGGRAHTPIGLVPLVDAHEGPVEVMVRPERILACPGDGGTVTGVEYFGHDAVYVVRIDGGPTVRSRVIGAPRFAPGERVALAFTGEPTVAYPTGAAAVPLAV
jgi:iron(III) transport system ATP-binding protein